MGSVTIDRCDIRLPAVPARAGRRSLVLALQVAVGAACLAGSFGGAVLLFSDHSEPTPGEIRVGRAAEWPDIKNGVPELAPVRPAPAPSHAAPPVDLAEPAAHAVSIPAQPAPVTTSDMRKAVQGDPEAGSTLLVAVDDPPPLAPELLASGPARATDAPPPELRSSASEVPPEPEPASATPRTPVAAPKPGASLRTASLEADGLAPQPVAGTRKADPRQRQRRAGAEKTKAAARQGPGRPSDTAAPRTKHASGARSVRGASVAAAPGGPPQQIPESSPGPAKDEPVRVLGIPVPGGRQIKEALDSFGDAVAALPGRL